MSWPIAPPPPPPPPGSAQNGVNLEFQVRFDLLKVKVDITPQILSKAFYTSEPNLVILAWTGHELSCGQASDWHKHERTDTHTHTDAGNDNTRRPKLASGENAKF